jgi:hypothetical protein
MTLSKMVIQSPIGEMTLVSRENAICVLDFSDRWSSMELMLRKRFGVFQVSEIKDLESSRLAVLPLHI